MAVRVRSHGSSRLRHIAARRERDGQGHKVIGALGAIEDGMHYAVGLVLLAVSAFALLHSLGDFLGSGEQFSVRITTLINSVLFVLIVMELLRTVMAHFEDAGLQLKPFVIIGTVAAVRHILTVGAKSSLGAAAGAAEFRRGEVELAVHAAVAMVLVVGLVPIRRSESA